MLGLSQTHPSQTGTHTSHWHPPWSVFSLAHVSSLTHFANQFTQPDPHSGVLVRALLSSQTSSSSPSLSEEIQCYSLPYGGIGLISHILTFYTVFWVGRDRRPLFPLKKLTQHGLDAMLGVLVMIATTVLCINVFVRCKDHWPLLFLGIWMWFSGLLNGVVAVHVALLRRHYSDVDHIDEEHAPPWIWSWFCESPQTGPRSTGPYHHFFPKTDWVWQ
jgi:hypothetical protein